MVTSCFKIDNFQFIIYVSQNIQIKLQLKQNTTTPIATLLFEGSSKKKGGVN